MAEKTAKGKPVIIICARNEEKWLGNTLRLIKRTRVDADIIVVDDRSTDGTAEIANRDNSVTELIQMKNPEKEIPGRGKGQAFLAGVRAALKRNPEAIVTMDADLTEVPAGLQKLIDHSKKISRGNQEIQMGIAGIIEGHPGEPFHGTSGIKSFSTVALHKLMQTKGVRKYVQGYGLESFWIDGLYQNACLFILSLGKPCLQMKEVTDSKEKLYWKQINFGKELEENRRDRH